MFKSNSQNYPNYARFLSTTTFRTTVAVAGARGTASETPETEEAVADTPAAATGTREGDNSQI